MKNDKADLLKQIEQIRQQVEKRKTPMTGEERSALLRALAQRHPNNGPIDKEIMEAIEKLESLHRPRGSIRTLTKEEHKDHREKMEAYWKEKRAKNPGPIRRLFGRRRP